MCVFRGRSRRRGRRGRESRRPPRGSPFLPEGELLVSFTLSLGCYQEAYLEPVSASFAWLVAALVCIKHFYHQTFTRGFDTLIEEVLDLI